jgi:phosphatidylserine decarboxylase
MSSDDRPQKKRRFLRPRLLGAGELATLGGAKSMDIVVRSRQTGDLIPEVVAGEGLMRLFYGTRAGAKLTTKLLVRRWLSFFGGLYYDTRLSKKKIRRFAEHLGISLEECEREIREYRSFNDFFARTLRCGARPLAAEPEAVVCPGDGRLLVFPQVEEETLSYVKWAPVRLMDLFNRRADLVERYCGGACAVLRLAPSDYHRFHFPMAGKVGITEKVRGLLHSVSPYVLSQGRPVFALNKRTLCLLETELFGQVLLMEVGAMGVGSIVQTAQPNSEVQRGDEKGYFKFGGSTTLFFVEKGRIVFDPDLVENSADGVETLVRMGERIAMPAPRG